MNRDDLLARRRLPGARQTRRGAGNRPDRPRQAWWPGWLKSGDWLIYYSPRVSLRAGTPLQAFTAIGRIPDDEVWQADEGQFKPWRRRVDYDSGAHDVSLDALRDRLELTAKPNWGYQLRRGLIELSPADFGTIRAAMKAG